jgi:hypothetical protein
LVHVLKSIKNFVVNSEELRNCEGTKMPAELIFAVFGPYIPFSFNSELYNL